VAAAPGLPAIGQRSIAGNALPDPDRRLTYEIREFPAEVLEESPELREYEYVVDEDNVVVVGRRDRRVIEIIDYPCLTATIKNVFLSFRNFPALEGYAPLRAWGNWWQIFYSLKTSGASAS